MQCSLSTRQLHQWDVILLQQWTSNSSSSPCANCQGFAALICEANSPVWVKWWSLHPRNEPSKSELQSSDGWVDGSLCCIISYVMTRDWLVKENSFQGWQAAPFPGHHFFTLFWMKDLEKATVTSPYLTFWSKCAGTNPAFRTIWLVWLLNSQLWICSNYIQVHIAILSHPLTDIMP